MAVILETGTGIRDANSYDSVAFVTSYLTGLNRAAENTWSTRTAAEQEAAVIAATQYIDTRWGPSFKGARDVVLDGRRARALLTVSGQPTAGDTLVVGSDTFAFATTLDDFNVDEIEIGADVDATIENVIAAINAKFEVFAALRDDTADQILLENAVEGSAGNDTILNADAATNIAVTQAFQHGVDEGTQPLEFPRDGLFDPSGYSVTGIPRRLKEATAEYAVRAVAAALYQDPTTDATGRVVQEKFEKVGPLEERTIYAEGAALEQLLKPYPVADRLLADYVRPPGVTR